jgi:DNA-binding response OmpR family regulator
MNILIVDEDEALASLLQQTILIGFYMLAKSWARTGQAPRAGLEFGRCQNAEQALEVLRNATAPWDVVFAACPRAADDVFVRACQEQCAGKYRSLVLVADRDHEEAAARSLKAGAHDCLWKPFGPEDLLKHLHPLR